MRYFIQFSYFGTAYHGWQKQPNAVTVQSVLEGVFSKLLRAEVSLMGAGRTDAGVHAEQMYAHFDAKPIRDIVDMVYRLNAFLPDDIAVQNIWEVQEDAHARFDATERTYEYWVTQEKNVFLTTGAHYVRHRLDVDGMNTAAALLLRHTDFECFSKSNTEVKTFRCDVKHAKWERQDAKLVFKITADRFLRNMVRAVVGTLLEVGRGQQNEAGVQRILDSKDRREAGTSVPAKGLYLTKIRYPKNTFSSHE
ncbi:tRNA pseudouridine(38-40) synthase TruA [Aggregatimonas sangjinii]|uniref:tRNA pseudouridine synthase A n=1 Tax=Aggregatimonas sangjinii TaxID=2583587 RepID=A0A5B7SRN6_9FLAO|nr:tRNA pseudouridine(38-40) synthase TruA [Aggregatimonas sangjinii]QCX00892.1 tRNA pseudouridine(38-40) synthase TruA [Aggregatimonas sangjinii]